MLCKFVNNPDNESIEKISNNLGFQRLNSQVYTKSNPLSEFGGITRDNSYHFTTEKNPKSDGKFCYKSSLRTNDFRESSLFKSEPPLCRQKTGLKANLNRKYQNSAISEESHEDECKIDSI